MRKNSASGVLARHCRLTNSAAFTNVTRFIRLNVPQGYAYAPSLAAALLDELFAHPAYTLMTNAPHKLIPACYAKIDLFAAC
ncbi:MAG: hypothetical protein E8D43_06940 [Nitrospira sp.]|nr:MAG: hypothetical protein E8D43_06940 [Nitrospira sp.]